MNKTLEDFARSNLKTNLALCPDDWQHRFKRMYSDKNLDLNINDVVDKMPTEKLDWAMIQVERSLQILSETKT